MNSDLIREELHATFGFDELPALIVQAYQPGAQPTDIFGDDNSDDPETVAEYITRTISLDACVILDLAEEALEDTGKLGGFTAEQLEERALHRGK